MIYRIEITRIARKALLLVPAEHRRRIERAIDALARTPRPLGAKKLEGTAGALRLRIGSYRVIYEVKDTALRVLVLKVAPRKDVYR